MKKMDFSKSISKRFLSIFLAIMVLVSSCFAVSLVVSANDVEEEQVTQEIVGAVKVNKSDYGTTLGQIVYLKPGTIYQFSYKFSTSWADNRVLRYYTSDTVATDYSSSYVFDAKYNMVTYTFTATATGAVTDENGNIKSYIGITCNSNETKYQTDTYVFGDFQLVVKGTTENLLRDLEFSSMQTVQNDTNAVWGTVNRGSGLPSGAVYSRYKINGEYPTRDFFRTGIKDTTVKLKNNASPYLLQKVNLKPETKYIFSYYYDTVEASKFVYYNIGSESDASTTTLTKTYDPFWKKVYWEFTTTASDTATVNAAIGIRCYNAIANGTYFAGFELYEASDATKTNLLQDTKFTNIGQGNSGHKWYGWYEATWANNNYERALMDTNKTDDMFKRSYTVETGTYTGGTVTADKATVTVGETATLNVAPDNGYELLEIQANGKSVPCVDGVYSFELSNYYADSSTGKVSITAKFITENTIPSFKANNYGANRAVSQDVWLEPDTEYVFEYKYTAVAAPAVKIGYVKSTGGNQDLAADMFDVVEDAYKIYARKFTTPSLDAENVTVGEGQNEGLVKCTVGFYFASAWQDETKFFGAPACYKLSDENKTNLLTNLDFSNINNSTGIWKSYWTSYPSYNLIGKYQDLSADAFMFPIGDCNRDNDVDIRDLVRMAIRIDTETFVTGNADMNNDGQHDELDIIALRKALLGIE